MRVQQTFGVLFHVGSDFARDGRQFDHLFKDGERFAIGGLQAFALHVPGHTPACMAYAIGDAVFVGDTLFMPDYGTARCDFPGGDAATLYRSIQRLLTLPDETRVFLCHDYKASERTNYAWETTIGEQRRDNVHVHAGVSEAAFVALREARDRTLGMPRLIPPSVQVNMRGGHLPEPEDNGVRYLKIPQRRLMQLATVPTDAAYVRQAMTRLRDNDDAVSRHKSSELRGGPLPRAALSQITPRKFVVLRRKAS